MTNDKKEVIQKHHLLYLEKDGEELVIPIRRKIHYYVTMLNRFNHITYKEKLALIGAILKANEKPKEYEHTT